MKPPKCRTCGKEEWRHVCGGQDLIVRTRTAGAPTARKSKTVTQTVTPSAKGGRGKKVHVSAAQKQAAYRQRKKAG